MRSKLPEAKTLEMEFGEVHVAERSPGERDQQGKDARSKRFGPENDFQTSNKNQNQQNGSTKRRVESSLPEKPSTKRRTTPTPTLKMNVSGINPTTRQKSLRQRRQQTGSSSSEVTFQEASIGDADFFRLINRRIQVYWSMDDAWYTGLIKRYDLTNKLHHVVYDDGEEEWVSLERDKFKIQILVPGEFSMMRNTGIGQSNRDDSGDSSVDSSQNKTSRSKVLKEEHKGSIKALENSQKTTSKNLLKNEQKRGIDVSEKRNSKPVKRLHGIDGRGIASVRPLPDIYERIETSNDDRRRPIANVLNHSSSAADDAASST